MTYAEDFELQSEARELLRKTTDGRVVVEVPPLTREDHVREAERLLAGTWKRGHYPTSYPDWEQPTEYALARAQVHALLAQVAPPTMPEKPAEVLDETSREAARLVASLDRPWWRWSR